MTTDIFIKTYRHDFQWLQESLKTIRRFWSGHRNVVIVCPERDVQGLRSFATGGQEKIVGVKETNDGYIFQQAVKLNAHNYTDADHIVYSDSDCLWKAPTRPEHFFRGSKPYMLYTRWEDVPEALMWRGGTEHALKQRTPAEFMRRHPLVYPKSVLKKMDAWFIKNHGVPASQLMLRLGRQWRLSEFNVMGSWAWLHDHDAFYWIDTKAQRHEVPEARLDQFWSYEGVTPQIRERVRALTR